MPHPSGFPDLPFMLPCSCCLHTVPSSKTGLWAIRETTGWNQGSTLPLQVIIFPQSQTAVNISHSSPSITSIICVTSSLCGFGTKGISSTSLQCVHIAQVGRICHGDIRPPTQAHPLPFLSGLVRQLPSRHWPLSLPDKSLTCRKPGYPNTAGAEDAVQLQEDMEEQHP